MLYYYLIIFLKLYLWIHQKFIFIYFIGKFFCRPMLDIIQKGLCMDLLSIRSSFSLYPVSLSPVSLSPVSKRLCLCSVRSSLVRATFIISWIIDKSALIMAIFLSYQPLPCHFSPLPTTDSTSFRTKIL